VGWGLELWVCVLQFAVSNKGGWWTVCLLAARYCAFVLWLNLVFLPSNPLFHLLLLPLLHFEYHFEQILHHLFLLVRLLNRLLQFLEPQLKLLKSFRRVFQGARYLKQSIFVMRKMVMDGISTFNGGSWIAGGKCEVFGWGDSICGVDEKIFEGVHLMVND
jgi:hypothetical protein